MFAPENFMVGRSGWPVFSGVMLVSGSVYINIINCIIIYPAVDIHDINIWLGN